VNLVDSSGWLEYFMNGNLAEKYAGYLHKNVEVLTPTIVLYEVFKVLKNQLGEESALEAAAQMGETNIAPLTDSIAYHAANLSLEYKLAMADSIIYSTAELHRARLITSDKDFKNLPKVLYLSAAG